MRRLLLGRREFLVIAVGALVSCASPQPLPQSIETKPAQKNQPDFSPTYEELALAINAFFIEAHRLAHRSWENELHAIFLNLLEEERTSSASEVFLTVADVMRLIPHGEEVYSALTAEKDLKLFADKKRVEAEQALQQAAYLTAQFEEVFPRQLGPLRGVRRLLALQKMPYFPEKGSLERPEETEDPDDSFYARFVEAHIALHGVRLTPAWASLRSRLIDIQERISQATYQKLSSARQQLEAQLPEEVIMNQGLLRLAQIRFYASQARVVLAYRKLPESLRNAVSPLLEEIEVKGYMRSVIGP